MASTARERCILAIPTIWIGVLTGPIMWSLHLIVTWGLIEIACEMGLATIAVFGISLVYLLIVAATILLLGATILAGIVAYQDWRRGGGGSFLDDEAEQAHPFMSFCGVIVSALFGLAIVLATYPILLLRPCADLGAAMTLIQ